MSHVYGVRHLLLAASVAWMGLPAIANEPLLMVFRDKPPYSYVSSSGMTGFLLERTQEILGQAGIPATFQDMPPKRIFSEIQNSGKPICSFGWYKIPEREAYAWFSKAIHTDKPHAVLFAGHSAASVGKHKTLASLMADPALTLSLADGVSYGPELDPMIARFPGQVDRGGIAPLQVANKVARGRADFMFIDQEDYAHLLKTNPAFRDENMVRFDFPDMPPGLKRYILCSQQVSDSVRRRIDAAIDQVVRRR